MAKEKTAKIVTQESVLGRLFLEREAIRTARAECDQKENAINNQLQKELIKLTKLKEK